MAILKGAFINLGAGLLGALPNIVVFQFNPDRVTRTPTAAQPPPASDGSGSRDARQQPGQPSETYNFMLRVDATDQLAAANPIAAASGVLPTLSALELLMVPQGSLTLDLFNLSGDKKPHQHPPERLPTVLFVWGPFRILPVNITSLSIVETQYDMLLNPIRAEDGRVESGECSADRGKRGLVVPAVRAIGQDNLSRKFVKAERNPN